MTEKTKVMRLNHLEQEVVNLLRQKKECLTKELSHLLVGQKGSHFQETKKLKNILEDKHLQDLENLLSVKFMTDYQMNLIVDAFEKNKNILITGISGAGKTTLLRALMDFRFKHYENDSVIVVDKTKELQKNVKEREMVRYKDSDSLTFSDFKNQLGSRPQIVLSEVNSDEDIYSMIFAIDTGMSVLATIQTKNPLNLLRSMPEGTVSLKNKEFIILHVNAEDGNRSLSIEELIV